VAQEVGRSGGREIMKFEDQEVKRLGNQEIKQLEVKK
jgi:hypothetical protein